MLDPARCTPELLTPLADRNAPVAAAEELEAAWSKTSQEQGAFLQGVRVSLNPAWNECRELFDIKMK